MIRLKQYGIELRRITSDDIELIRTWRNHPDIRKTMAYQKKISPVQQKEWFKRIDNKLNYYFLILIKNEPVGVINCKEVNEKDQYGEGGIFIWDEQYRSTPYPVFATLVLTDFIFNELKYGDKSFIRTLKDNTVARTYNQILGYTLIPGQQRVKNQWYVLTRETFNRKAKSLRKAAMIYTQTDGVLEVYGEISKKNIMELNTYIEQLNQEK